MSRHPSLKYALDSLEREEFDKMDRLVRSVLLAPGKQGIFPKNPRKVTNDAMHIAKPERVDCQKAGYDGWCFTYARTPDQFDIWINPKLDLPGPYGRTTLLHELCHGHIGNRHGHGFVWKRFFSRVMMHYSDLVHPIYNVTDVVLFTLKHYTKRAKGETDDQFSDRILNEYGTIGLTVNLEYERVVELYELLSKRESRGNGHHL